jgi:hypothetical protein
VVELEGLSLGIEGKRLMWIVLQEIAGPGWPLSIARLQELAARAERQRADVEAHRRAVAAQALSG